MKEYCPERKGAAPEGAYNTYRQKWYEKQNSKKQPKRPVQKSAPARKTQATRPAAGVQPATARQVSSFQPGSETFAPVSTPVSAPLTGLKKFLVEILDLFMLFWSGLLLWMHLDVLHGFSKIIFMLVMGITTFVSAQYTVRGFSQRKPFLLIIFGILLRFTVILTLYFVMLVKLGL